MNSFKVVLYITPIIISYLIYNLFTGANPEITIGGFKRNIDTSISTRQGELIDEGEKWAQYNDWFLSEDAWMCHAWLFKPKNIKKGENVPIVILGHGFGSTKQMSLEKYGKEFAKNGIAAYAFDYRTFGGSDGEPRHMIAPFEHVKDWKNAIKHIKAKVQINERRGSPLAGRWVDHTRIGLWGTSFAGGHVLVTGSELGKKNGINAIVSQVPHLDGRAASLRNIKKIGVTGVLKIVVAVVSDYVLSAIGFGPASIKIAGLENELALMRLPENELETYFSKHPKVYMGGWQNLACARIALKTSKYNPIDYVEKIDVPVLYVGAQNDILCPMNLVEEAHKKTADSEILSFNADHFEIYAGDIYDELVQKYVEFFKKHL